MTPKLEERIHQITISANKYAWEHFQIVLDFSEASLTKLETVIQEEKNIAADDIESRFDLQKSSRVWGIYLGEIIRKTIGGIWYIEKNELTLKVFREIIFPINFITKILMDESNNSVSNYYKDLCNKISAGTNVFSYEETISEGKNHGIPKNITITNPDEIFSGSNSLENKISSITNSAISQAKEEFDFSLDYSKEVSMPTRMGYSLMAVTGLFFFFGSVGIAASLESTFGIKPLFGLLIASPSMGYIFHHVRNWIAVRAGIKPNKSPISMMLMFSVLIIFQFLFP